MKRREELAKQLRDLNIKSLEIRKEINALDFEQKIKESEVYLNKYFLEICKGVNDKYIHIVFVYGIDENCEPKSIRCSYLVDNVDFFQLENSTTFNPKKWDDEDNFIEISKEEFYKHYEIIKEKINSNLQNKL